MPPNEKLSVGGVTLAMLSESPRWVAWQTEPRGPERKPTKVPYSPAGGRAKADDPGTWGNRPAAEARAPQLLRPFGTGGVGIELGDHDGIAIAGIDLDTCIAETGDLAPWALKVMERFDTYAEISPSGTGIKLFFIYEPEEAPALRRLMGGDEKTGRKWCRKGESDHPPGVEFYISGRFFAVTDQRHPDSPTELRRVALTDLQWLIEKVGPAMAGDAKPKAQTGEGPGSSTSSDGSRSAAAFKVAAQVKRAGGTYEDYCQALEKNRETAAWKTEKGHAHGDRQLRRTWERAGQAVEGQPAWLEKCQRDRMGEPRANLVNVMEALRGDPRLKGLFAHDEMERAELLMAPVPGMPGKLEVPRPVQDADISALLEFLQRCGLEKIGKEAVFQAMILRAREQAFHPVRDYLNGLSWDGTSRLKAWLPVYLGAEASPYTAGIGSMFMVAMVARVLEPGCKADYMMVLEGPQGAMKSTACRILGGQWFSDSLPSVDGDAVRVAQHLRGKWLIEIAEMSAMSKAESASLKAFITSPIEQFTPKYGRLEVREPRQCLFIGTTNKTAYLRDETGGRRFWPVKVGEVLDVAGLARDRDQLFAEAVHLYREGAAWWPSRAFEGEHIAPQQASRFEEDPWQETVSEYLEGRVEVTPTAIAAHALGLDTSTRKPDQERRITSILQRLGWELGQRTKHSRPWIRCKTAGDR